MTGFVGRLQVTHLYSQNRTTKSVLIQVSQ